MIGPAERADLIVDFAAVPTGSYPLRNVGPDEPYGGGVPGVDFEPADPATTGLVMQFRVGGSHAADPTTPPQYLKLPAITPFPAETVTRRLALLEHGHEEEGPTAALLGSIRQGPEPDSPEWDGTGTGHATAQMWMDEVSTNPAVGATEVWEI